jgi:glutathione synthase/RimK-type ligase-like ATP-grasp enzyme
MNVQIAIHHRTGSYSDRWVEYCEENGIAYNIVDCFQNDILQQLKSMHALLWHWHHEQPEEVLVARHILRSAEKMGLKVYPNVFSCWHFDDKIAQKYLLESIDAPLVPSYVFYNLHEAIAWIKSTAFPKVFKLRKGASAHNVKLVRNAEEAIALAKIAFNRGFKPVAGYFDDFETKAKKKRPIGAVVATIRRMPQIIKKKYKSNKAIGRERGYIYFQEYIPENQYDIRIVVIGKRIFAYTRDVRKGDFRASGSGSFNYDQSRIQPECIKTAYEIAGKIGTQSLAFDFMTDRSGEPKIIEISYCFGTKGLNQCPGFFDGECRWYNEQIRAEDAILIDFLDQL